MCIQRGKGAGAGWVCLYVYALCISCLIKTLCFKHPRVPAARQAALLVTVETTHLAQRLRQIHRSHLRSSFPGTQCRSQAAIPEQPCPRDTAQGL